MTHGKDAEFLLILVFGVTASAPITAGGLSALVVNENSSSHQSSTDNDTNRDLLWEKQVNHCKV
eukprot:CAMPEP_0185855548 /NCGR_PEP_ID=MMETSP1354-20130828/26071_1 /TAXON_ID=708628 /ORGANISM="Erythrolobus madagascarensis, Strain CCMP3276" /LENGTH=63 /DNA_ID=CAMNT_0028557597 /DNA_START=21 /DNA_END=209 /DNA_ORIENTATION=-